MSMLKNDRVEIRLSKDEKEALERIAETRGISVSEFLRWAIRRNDTRAVVKST